MSLDIITGEENLRRHRAWLAKRARWLRRGGKGAGPQFYPRAGYTVVYDEPDTDGHWGRRLESYFSVKGDTSHEEKSAHDQVRAKFVEMMDGRPHTIYQVDV